MALSVRRGTRRDVPVILSLIRGLMSAASEGG
jgi:hypothetical protein